VNAHRVPAALADPFMSGVNALSAQRPACVPAVPAQPPEPKVTTAPPPPAPRRGHHGHEHGHGHGHENGD
jgi:hypothetical protein